MADGKSTPPPLSPHEEGENPSTKPYMHVLQPKLHSDNRSTKIPELHLPSTVQSSFVIVGSQKIFLNQGSSTDETAYRSSVIGLKLSDFAASSTTSSLNYQDTPRVVFQKSDKAKLLAGMKHVLIAKFTHGRPSVLMMQKFLSYRKLIGKTHVSNFDAKHIFIEFEMFEDFVKFWIKQNGIINGFPVRFFKWDELFDPNKESSIVPVWIHLPQLPLFLFEEGALLLIASALGRPLHLDGNNLNRNKISYATICIELDILKAPPREVWIQFGEGTSAGNHSGSYDGFRQKIVYGFMPPFCSCCCHIGHLSSVCKRFKTRVAVKDALDVCPVLARDGLNNGVVKKMLGIHSGLMESSSFEQAVHILEEGELDKSLEHDSKRCYSKEEQGNVTGVTHLATTAPLPAPIEKVAAESARDSGIPATESMGEPDPDHVAAAAETMGADAADEDMDAKSAADPVGYSHAFPVQSMIQNSAELSNKQNSDGDRLQGLSQSSGSQFGSTVVVQPAAAVQFQQCIKEKGSKQLDSMLAIAGNSPGNSAAEVLFLSDESRHDKNVKQLEQMLVRKELDRGFYGSGHSSPAPLVLQQTMEMERPSTWPPAMSVPIDVKPHAAADSNGLQQVFERIARLKDGIYGMPRSSKGATEEPLGCRDSTAPKGHFGSAIATSQEATAGTPGAVAGQTGPADTARNQGAAETVPGSASGLQRSAVGASAAVETGSAVSAARGGNTGGNAAGRAAGSSQNLLQEGDRSLAVAVYETAIQETVHSTKGTSNIRNSRKVDIHPKLLSKEEVLIEDLTFEEGELAVSSRQTWEAGVGGLMQGSLLEFPGVPSGAGHVQVTRPAGATSSHVAATETVMQEVLQTGEAAGQKTNKCAATRESAAVETCSAATSRQHVAGDRLRDFDGIEASKGISILGTACSKAGDATQVKAFVHEQIEEIKQEIGQTELKIRDAAKEEKGEGERVRKSTAQEEKQLARELKFVRERKNLKEYFRASAEKINSDFQRKRSEKKEKTTGNSFKYGEG